MKRPEILAPAGSMESLDAALEAGADAVYIGGKSFSARASAQNFSLDEIKTAVQKCHLRGVKLHLAVNTCIFDDELYKLENYIYETASLGVDCYIIQDLAVLNIIKKISPQIPCHASTQLSIHTKNGALWAKSVGFSRVVLSRELSRDEIKEISQIDGIETEIFVHGALCMSLSGQCLMSSMIGGRSANRGCCAQSCRLPFSANSEKYYALSLKDLSMLNHLNEMASFGVNSFKIEGRMKRPEYVSAAVRAVRNSLTGKMADIDTLKNVFSRSGFTDGYYTGKRKEMFGVRTKEDVKAADQALEKIHKYEKLRLIPIEIKAEFITSKSSHLEINDESGNEIKISGDVVEIAKKAASTEEKIKENLQKLGDTCYYAKLCEVKISPDAFVPVSKVNKLRREAIEKLNQERILKNFPDRALKAPNYIPNFFTDKRDFRLPDKKYLRFRVSTIEQFQTLMSINKSLYIEVPLYLFDEIKLFESLENKENIYILPPEFILNENEIVSKLLEIRGAGYENLIISNISYVKTAEDLGFKLFGDFRQNTTNSVALEFLKSSGFENIIISPEMKLKEIDSLNTGLPLGLISYGKLPLMTVRNCPIQNQIGSCKGCNNYLTDRTRRKMPVYCRYNKSYSIIYNSDTFLMYPWKIERNKNLLFYEIMFLNETKDETKYIAECYINNKELDIEKLKISKTSGLYYRGIER